MAGPWDKYAAQQPQQGPWAKYAQPNPTQQAAASIAANPPGMPDVTPPELRNTTTASANPPQGSAALRGVQSFNESFGVPKSVQNHPSEAVQGLKMAVQHPGLLKDSLKEQLGGILPAQNAAFDQGKSEFLTPGATNKVAGAVHMIESGVPFLGPALVKADNQIGSGDTAGGLGTVGASVLQAASLHPQSPEMASNAAALPKAAVTATGDVLKNRSYGLYNNVLGTKGKNTAFGANPGRGVAAEGIWGKRQTILDSIPDAIKERAQQKSAVLNLPQNAAKSVDVSGAVNDPFQSALNNGVSGVTSDATLRRLQQTQRELTTTRSLGADGEIQYGAPKDLSRMNPAQADALKSDIYGRTNYANPELDQAVNNTLRQSGGGVKTAIENAVPEVKPFNQRLQDLYGAQTSLGKIVNNRMVSPTRSGFTEVAPAIIGEAVGGGPAAAAAVATREIGRLPAVRTGVAQGMYRLGNVLSPEGALRVPEPQAPPPVMIRGLLPSAPTQLGPTSLQNPFTPPPAYSPTTRAERMNLLLPEKAGGRIPASAAPPGSPLWVELQKQGRHP